MAKKKTLDAPVAPKKAASKAPAKPRSKAKTAAERAKEREIADALREEEEAAREAYQDQADKEYGDDGDDMEPDGSLTLKAQAFVREYPIDFNASKAAIRAGYSAKTAGQAGHRLLKNVEIQAALAKVMKGDVTRARITRSRIIDEYAKMAFSNLADFLDFDEKGQAYIKLAGVPREAMAALGQIEITELPPLTQMVDGQEMSREVVKIKIKHHDKKGALDSLAKRFGLLKERVHHSGTIKTNNVPVEEVAKRLAFVLASAGKQKPKG